MGTRQEEIKLCIYFFRDVFSYWRSKEQAVLYGIQILNTLRPFREDLEENNLEGKDNIYARFSPTSFIKYCQQNLKLPNRWIEEFQVATQTSNGHHNHHLFLCGFIMSKVHHTQPRDINEFKNRIHQTISEITMKMLHSTMASWCENERNRTQGRSVSENLCVK